ncbi:MAG TPA: cytochrome c [Polyangiaceae bacterium]
MRRSVPLLSCLLLLGACRERPGDLREWQPSDHDHTSSPNAAQVEIAEDGGATTPTVPGLDEVVLIAWQKNCTDCHGPVGRGDGPRAAMAKPPDLRDPAFQARTSDEQIRQVVKLGRGAMPAFDLPDATIDGLVRLVRLLDASRIGRADAGDAASAHASAADASAAPDASRAATTPEGSAALAPTAAPATTPAVPPSDGAPPGLAR